MNKYFLHGAVILFLAIATVGAVRGDVVHPTADHLFGISAGYNSVVFGNYTGISGDTEGHLAVQGDMTVKSHAIGAGQMVAHQDGPVLVVGGNVYAQSSGVYDGDAYIGGKMVATNGAWNAITVNDNTVVGYNSLDPNYKATKGDIHIGDTSNFNNGLGVYDYMHELTTELPFDFAVAKEQLKQVSTDLSNLTATTAGEFVGDNFVIDLTGLSGLQVVDVDASVFQQLADLGSLQITGEADTTLIINVTDVNGLNLLDLSTEFFVNGEHGESYNDVFDGRNILINTDVSTVYAEHTSVNASVLAMNALFDVQHGHISGQTFGAGATLTNGGEFHAYYSFDDKHFQGGGVPEPATMLIFGVGLGVLPLARRLRRKSA